MSGPLRGSCLCGAVRFVIDGKHSPVGQCHCSRCRKVSGTDGNAVFLASYKAFRWLSGEANARRYIVPGTRGWTSCFCETCGSPLPHPDSRNKIYFVPAGLMDDDPGFRGYAEHIYVGSKAPWVVISDNAPQYEADSATPRLDTSTPD